MARPKEEAEFAAPAVASVWSDSGLEEGAAKQPMLGEPSCEARQGGRPCACSKKALRAGLGLAALLVVGCLCQAAWRARKASGGVSARPLGLPVILTDAMPGGFPAFAPLVGTPVGGAPRQPPAAFQPEVLVPLPASGAIAPDPAATGDLWASVGPPTSPPTLAAIAAAAAANNAPAAVNAALIKGGLVEEAAPGGPAWAVGVKDKLESVQQNVGHIGEAVAQALARVGVPNFAPTSTTITITQTTTTTPAPCGHTEDGMNYPGNDLRSIPDVVDAGYCCNECAKDPMCVAWTYGKTPGMPFHRVCYLKGSRPRLSITEIRDVDFISGMPTQVGRSIQVQLPLPGASLYCFSLVVPDTYELGMIKMQWEERASIFDCDEFATYSNRVLELAPGLTTGVVNTTLQCPKGGEFGTALNTDIFLAVWDKVLRDGRFTKHDWTVKVDPDAVFFPQRMRAVAYAHPEQPNGVYLNNCMHGLHGPIEAFSRTAIYAWADGRRPCYAHFSAVCQGDCGWGEDMFIDQCLDKVLHVSRQFEPRLLVEDHCDPPPGWERCLDPNVVSYHPFKTPEAYKNCMHTSAQVAAARAR